MLIFKRGSETMRKRMASKLNSRGMSWLIAVMLVLIIVLSITAMIPSYRRYQERGKALACATALDTARRQLATDYMSAGFENGKAQQAKEFVGQVMNGWDDLCPDYGTVYIVPRDGDTLAWDVVCGLHNSDKKLCTRLNSDYVLEQLREAYSKGYAGAALFSFDARFVEDLVPALRIAR